MSLSRRATRRSLRPRPSTASVKSDIPDVQVVKGRNDRNVSVTLGSGGPGAAGHNQRRHPFGQVLAESRNVRRRYN